MKSILLTGGSGFLGKVIEAHLCSANYSVKKLGRQSDDDFIFDLIDNAIILDGSFDLIIHSAGKAHSIPKSQEEKSAFLDVNVNGTLNLLRTLKQLSILPKSFVFISSVAVYGLNEGCLIDENEPLKATDPYGLSKVKAEQLVQEWCIQNNIISAILRLPLLAGNNPPGNLGAMIKGISKGYYFNIAGGKAKKSIVLAEDVPKIIPKAAEIGGIYNLSDGYHPSFSELSELIASRLGKSKPSNIPNWLASSMAMVGDILGTKFPINSNNLRKITSDLTFDDSKARELLGWNPTPVLYGFNIEDLSSA